MVTLTSRGNFNKTEKFLQIMVSGKYKSILGKYAQQGVQALSSATPKDTGETAGSWDYRIEQRSNGIAIVWTNSHIEKGVNIAVILQYGHGTRNGGYVAGRDYINPAMRPVFDKIADAAWKEVAKA